jgi:hypothetical protein
MATARARHSAAANQGEVIVTGGIAAGAMVQTAERYNINGWWPVNSPVAVRRASHTSVKMQNGDIMIIGGRDGSTTLNTAWSYNRLADTWTARGTLSAARVGHTADALSTGQILVTGGGPYNSTNFLASCEMFNPTTNTWTRTADLLYARSGHASTVLSDDRVFVSGGLAPGAGALALNTVERFRPSTETWSDQATLATARAFHTSIYDPSAKALMVAGGVNKAASPTYYASAERLTVGSNTVLAYNYFDGSHSLWSPDLPEVNPLGDPNYYTRITELKGTLYTTGVSNTPRPLVVMLHGNHNSCSTGSAPHIDSNNSYAYSGTCPNGYTEVRSDKGFAYVAAELALRGFMVVSIDANLGIAGRDDGSLDWDFNNLRVRARLVLKTLQHIMKWNSGAAPTPGGMPSQQGQFDMQHIGLVGHSRGGEGVRGAVSMLQTEPEWINALPNVQVKGVLEIGSTQNTQTWDNVSTPWALLMGTCDSNNNYVVDNPAFSGVRVFDRLIQSSNVFVGQYFVWGANHNFYNSEWQTTDVDVANCGPSGTALYEQGGAGSGYTGSVRQRQTAVTAITHFMQALVAPTPDTTQLSVFDPAKAPVLPAIKVSRVHQMNSASRWQLEDFHLQYGHSAFGFDTVAHGVTVTQPASSVVSDTHDFLPVAQVAWTTAAAGNDFQVNWAAASAGLNFTPYNYFEMRLDRNPANPASAATNFSVKLVNANGTLSNAVQIASYTSLTGPASIGSARQYPIGAVKIPLSAFTGATLNAIHGVRFVFDQSTSGTVLMTNIRVKQE